jgi:transcriptional regulator with PAS, ATPase and Fis domain
MKEAVSKTRRLSATDNNILVQGPTGVGKELFATFIHAHSNRRGGVLLPINCSSIPEHLFESELFGFRRGAFTGANSSYDGRFVQAHEGTLFLDEVGEFPLQLQAKLLRVLDSGKIYQLGNKHPVPVDVRIIAATNKKLWEEVQRGRFRKDLYFRLNEALITIPPLAQRIEDILPLTHHFIGIFNKEYQKNINHIKPEAEELLKNHPWEGNVRELKNVLRNIYPLKDNDTITAQELCSMLGPQHHLPNCRFQSLEDHQLSYIQTVLNAYSYNIKKAAAVLKISRSRLYRKLGKIRDSLK